MQKIKPKNWIAALALWLGLPSAYASDYGFWFPVLVMGAFFVALGLGVAGLVLVYKDVQDNTKDRLTWKFYTGAALLVPALVVVGINVFA